METPSCTKCHRRPSAYHRPYSGERLCTTCFTASIKERVQRTIASHKMLQHDSRIAIGLSGGKDSLALLNILAEIEKDHPQAEIVAVTIDEGVTGYRDEALSIAARACKKLGIEHTTATFGDLFGTTMDEIARRDRTLATCTYCGVLRRRALNQAARGLDADRLATAHNLDDMAQTALLNILRGDTNRLAMIHPGGTDLPGLVRRIKPYCEIPEKESTLYAYVTGLEFQSLPCPHAAEAMRNDIRDFLNRMEDGRPGTKFTVYKTALKIAPEAQARRISLCKNCGEPTPSETCRACQLLEQLQKEE